MPDIVRITDLPLITPDGTEQVEVAGLSPTVTITATTISATGGASDTYNDSANGFLTAGFAVGDRISISGFTNANNNNESATIVTVTAGEINTDITTLANEAAGDTVTISKWQSSRVVATGLGGGSAFQGFWGQSVAGGGTQSGIVALTFTEVTYLTEIFDTENAYNPATGRFIVPASLNNKYMQFSCGWGSAGNRDNQIGIYYERAGLNLLALQENSRGSGSLTTPPLQVQTDDEVFVYVYFLTGPATLRESRSNFFSGHVVGE